MVKPEQASREERREAVYRERALRLARPPAPLEPPPAVALLVFRVGPERFGLELGGVLEVVARADCVPVPGSPETLAGVVNLRGEITPVWNLARLLGLTGGQPGGAVILVRRDGAAAALAVDGVEEIRRLERRRLAPPPPGALHARAITPDLVTVLEPEHLFDKESS